MNGSSKPTVSLGAFVGFGVTMYYLGRGNLLQGLNIRYVGFALTLQVVGFLVVMTGLKYGKPHRQAVIRSDVQSNFGTVLKGMLLTGISVFGLVLMSASVFVPGLAVLLKVLHMLHIWTTAFVSINQLSFVNAGVVALLLLFAGIFVRQLLPAITMPRLGNPLSWLHLPSRKQRSEPEFDDFAEAPQYVVQRSQPPIARMPVMHQQSDIDALLDAG
jgi:hypothetical protein